MAIFDEQLILDKVINNIVLNSCNSQAYILVGNDKKYLKDKALLLSKALICPLKYQNRCTSCNICKRIDENNFGELKVINSINGLIKKDDIIKLKNSFQTNSIEGKNQVYIITDAELLNQSAANAMLKFLEEPESNTVAIFTTTNIDLVVNTIISRCQIVRLGSIKTQKENDLVLSFCNFDEEHFECGFEFFIKVEKNYKMALVNIKDELLTLYNDRESLISLLKLFILAYKDMLNYKLFGVLDFFANNQHISYACSTQEDNVIIKKISFILDNMEKLEYNVNVSLFINNLVIGIGEISNGRGSRS